MKHMGTPVGSVTSFKDVRSCHCPGTHSLQMLPSHLCTKMLTTQYSSRGMLFSPCGLTVEACPLLPMKLAPAFYETPLAIACSQIQLLFASLGTTRTESDFLDWKFPAWNEYTLGITRAPHLECAFKSYRKERTMRDPNLAPGSHREPLFCVSL